MSDAEDLLGLARAKTPLESLPEDLRAHVEAWHETELARQRELTKRERAKRKWIEEQLAQSLRDYEDVLTIVHGEAPKPVLAPIQKKSGQSPAAAVLLWSDHHIDAIVTPAVTNGQNEYTLDIAWERFRTLIERTRWQIESWQKISALDTIVIAALGDWIAGDIHPELAETSLPPQEATRIVREMHEWGITELLKIKGITRIAYKGMTDNHGRHTKKNQWINGHQKSHNWGMYHALSAIFRAKGEARVDFEIPEGSLCYTDVMGYTFRLAHGHQINYGGGVGGISIPGLKWVGRTNAGRHAHYTCIGHFHQARYFGPLIVNGSLIGPDAYSNARGFEPEAPCQLALLVRPEFGVCDVSFIYPRRTP